MIDALTIQAALTGLREMALDSGLAPEDRLAAAQTILALANEEKDDAQPATITFTRETGGEDE